VFLIYFENQKLFPIRAFTVYKNCSNIIRCHRRLPTMSSPENLLEKIVWSASETSPLLPPHKENLKLAVLLRNKTQFLQSKQSIFRSQTIEFQRMSTGLTNAIFSVNKRNFVQKIPVPIYISSFACFSSSYHPRINE